MKILKYTFSIPKLIVDNGELLEVGETKETHTFTLLFKGVDLYEKISGSPLLTDISKINVGNNDPKENVKNMDINLIKNLAKASYVKIENDSFHQNLVTADEFTKTLAFSKIGTDMEFMSELLNMVLDCCLSEKQMLEIKKTTTSKK